MNERAITFKPELNTVLFVLYLEIVSFIYIFVYVSTDPLRIILTLLGLGAVYYVLTVLLFHLLRRITAHTSEDASAKASAQRSLRSSLIVFAVSALATFGLLMIWYRTYYPGCFGEDSLKQFIQVLEHNYNDWHPAWHTLIFFALPVKLFGREAIWPIVFFQIIYFSLTMGYLTAVIYRYAGVWFAVISFIYVMLNPYTEYLVMFPYKDVAFAMAGAICAAYAAQILITHGEWSSKWWRCALLGVMLANATIFRHNGILFTGLILLALLFIMNKKQWLKVLLFFLVTMFVIKVPIYHRMSVDTSPQPVMQVVGVPMTIFANVVAQTPDRLDDEMREFAYDIAPQETWERFNLLGNFELMRYGGDINDQAIEDKGARAIIGYGLKCFKIAPKQAFTALFAVTDIVYGPNPTDEGFVSYGCWGNQVGLYTDVDERMSNVLMGYYNFILMKGRNFTRQTAFALIMMLAMMLGVCSLKSLDDWKVILLSLPIFAYNFGTMLFLFWGESRFFYITYPVCPIVILMLLKYSSERNERT